MDSDGKQMRGGTVEILKLPVLTTERSSPSVFLPLAVLAHFTVGSPEYQHVLRLRLHWGGSERRHVPVCRRDMGTLGSPRESLMGCGGAGAWR